MAIGNMVVRRWCRVLLVLLLVGAMGGGAYWLRRRHVRRQWQEWKTDGIAAAKAGDNARAVELLTKYLRVVGRDRQALRAYADVRLRVISPSLEQATEDTIAALEELVLVQPASVDDQRQLMSLYARCGDDADAVRMAETILANSPDDASVLSTKTALLVRQGSLTEALPIAEHWASSSPLDFEAQRTVLTVLQMLKRSAGDIIARAADLRAARPSDPRFETLEAYALNLVGESSEPPVPQGTDRSRDGRSAADWLRAAASRPLTDLMFTRVLVGELNKAALFDESLAVLRRGAAGNDAWSQRELCGRLWELSRWDELAAAVEQIKPSDGRSGPEALALGAIASLKRGAIEKAKQSEQDLTLRPDDPEALAWAAVLRQFIDPANYDARLVIDSCARAGVQQSGDPYLRYFLAVAFLQLGETELATDELARVATTNATWVLPAEQLADLEIGLGRGDLAVAAAQEAMRRAAPDGSLRDVAVAVTLASAWAAEIDAGYGSNGLELNRLADAIQAVAPGEEKTLCIKAGLLARSGNIAAAKAMLLASLHAATAPSEQTLLHYAGVSQVLGLAIEQECFDRSEKEHGITPALAYARAVWLGLHADPAKGLDMLRTAREHASGANAVAWQTALARCLDATRQPQARDAWVALAQGQPQDLTVQRLAVASPSAREDRAFIDRTIEQIHKLTGETAVSWRVHRARWVLAKPVAQDVEIKDALDLLNATLAACPSYAEAHLLAARCAARLHDDDSAFAHVQRAGSLNPRSSEIALDLAKSYESRGQFALAAAALKPVADGPRATASALTEAGWLKEHDNSSDDAERLYRRALEIDPSFAIAGNNLAMVLARRDDAKSRAEAVELATATSRSHPQAAGLLDTLAFACDKAGQHDAALTDIQRAVELAPHDLRYKVRQVELLASAGKPDAAMAALSGLDKLAKDNPAALTADIQGRLDHVREAIASK